MRWLSLTIVVVLFTSVLPTDTVFAGSEHDHHWNGYVLDRDPISDHVLLDQNYDYYSLKKGNSDVVVVAFIFTTCPDVCPVITSNLVTAEKQLEGVDYQFISITVDPAKDTPGALREYSEMYEASWPHLTAELEDMQAVWDDFEIYVNTTEIENHDHDHGHDHDEDSMDHDGDSTVTVVMPNGTSNEYHVEPKGWHQLTASAYQEGWTINSSYGQYGNFVNGINGDEAPANGSWWWQLHTWNESASAWEESMIGIDEVETGPLAFAPNSTEDSSIPVPSDAHASVFSIVQSNGTVVSTELTNVSAWHMSLGALNSFDAPDSDWGHYMNSIDGVDAPTDYSWWWQLHYWNETSESWDESMLGMDSLIDKEYIAWAPNSTSDDLIPTPEAEVVETSTSHSTQTFILDADWEPKLVYLGYDWDVDEFVEDVEGVADLKSSAHDHDHGLPGFTFATIAAGIGLAIIASSRDD